MTPSRVRKQVVVRCQSGSTPSPLGVPPRLSAKLCRHTVAARESIKNSSRLGSRFRHCAGLAGTVSPSSDCNDIPVIDGSVLVFSAGVIGVSRDVLPALGALIPPETFHRMAPRPCRLDSTQESARSFWPWPYAFAFALPSVSSSLSLSSLLFSRFLPLPLPFLSPLPFLPNIERSMGTTSPAAVSACARQ